MISITLAFESSYNFFPCNTHIWRDTSPIGMNKPQEGLLIGSDYVHTVRTYLGSIGVRSGKGRGARGVVLGR